MKAVVLDFGGPVLVTPFERLRALERSLGLAPRTFGWRGPFDPTADPLWRSMQAGELTEPAYWAERAAEVAAVSGEDGVPALMARLFDGPEEELVRPQARALVAEAKAAGLETAVLTNDLHAFQTWNPFARMDPAAKNTFEGPLEGAGCRHGVVGQQEHR